ncbi:hypothetical protein EYR41_007421 [Orbilia oligospora]|uniref:Uncharacterized protein n=1 Tax=Orbilia oligospora TaxID=2813651 RepID=A0A7C8P3W9_ORBOL|nr:hypothetical protein TWF751_002881 [Orbilia oligospora]TGJ68366.1 hypothetical protein EYR41_007421 [Orbilia oligospora]
MNFSYIKAFLLVFFAYDAVASAVPDKPELQERDYRYYGAAPVRTTKHVTPAKCSTKMITKTITKYSKITKKVTATGPQKTIFITYTKILTVTATATVTLSVVSTSIKTVTKTACPTPDLSCSNRGLEYAVYRHLFTNDDNSRRYPDFNVEYFKTAIPLFNDTTPIVGIVGDNTTDAIYRRRLSVNGLDYTAVNHRGYLFAPQSGIYTFGAYSAHDITLIWIGATAFSGFTRANANIEQGVGDPRTYDISLTVGKYYPIRILWGNARAEAYLNFTVIAPNGEVIISSNKEASPYLVTNSCDGTTAPAFAPFGQES